MPELETHQKQILRFIERYENQNGRTPSYEEIRLGTGMRSKDHVYRDVQALEQKEFVRREPAISRGITLLRTADGYPVTPFAYSIPVLGRILEDEATPAASDIREWIEITRAMIPDAEDVFAFRIVGNSMIDAFVNDGDLVVAKKQVTARNGELVAVRVHSRNIDHETSLKRFFRYGNEIWLQAENSENITTKHRPEAVRILGKVLCIIRHIPDEQVPKVAGRRAA